MLVAHTRPAMKTARRGAAAVELALLLPMILFLLLIATDYARVFYYSITVTNCARNGAIFACDPVPSGTTPYKTTEEAALADASNLSGVSVTSKKVTDGSESFAEVSVNYSFQTITRFPGIPDTVSLIRTVRMRNVAIIPKF